jgi:hypothetical protein
LSAAPLEAFRKLLADDEIWNDPQRLLDVAIKAAPYYHPKLANIEMNGTMDQNVIIEMLPEEKAAMEANAPTEEVESVEPTEGGGGPVAGT